jgi:hypothetical protein
MTKLFLSLLAVALAAGIQGCAAPGEPTTTVDKDKDYVTGSNIPRKDKAGVKTMSKEEFDRMQSRPGAPYDPAKL